MIYGVGIDIVEVAEIEGRLARDTFARAFSEEELAYAAGLPLQRAEILAGRWAAKEAFGKALGTGLRAEWRLSEIEVAHDGGGRPVLRLSARVREYVPAGTRLHCSLSHSRGCACAVVVIETEAGA